MWTQKLNFHKTDPIKVRNDISIIIKSITTDKDIIEEVTTICGDKPKKYATNQVKFNNGWFQRLLYGSTFDGLYVNFEKGFDEMGIVLISLRSTNKTNIDQALSQIPVYFENFFGFIKQIVTIAVVLGCFLAFFYFLTITRGSFSIINFIIVPLILFMLFYSIYSCYLPFDFKIPKVCLIKTFF
eukprot:TRINITY_DN5749_c0_g1_i1.p1 TRINITY_DN5749_c0_g1~~TRINITY_DN5749_c0_g1_i1.p1  ORF type:complete len:184 (+),score=37.30 TRINITY_DN5749_c0_g1_i1:620-1171(+)